MKLQINETKRISDDTNIVKEDLKEYDELVLNEYKHADEMYWRQFK